MLSPVCAVIHAGTDLSSTVCKSPKPCLHRYCRGRLMLRDTPGRTERCMTCRPELCWFRIKMIDDCDYVSWVPSLTSRSIRRRLCAVAAPSVSSACLQGAPSVPPPVRKAPVHPSRPHSAAVALFVYPTCLPHLPPRCFRKNLTYSSLDVCALLLSLFQLVRSSSPQWGDVEAQSMTSHRARRYLIASFDTLLLLPNRVPPCAYRMYTRVLYVNSCCLVVVSPVCVASASGLPHLRRPQGLGPYLTRTLLTRSC